MKDPHNSSEYEKIPDGIAAPNDAASSDTQNSQSEKSEPKRAGKKKQRYSGAYYYIDADAKKLAETSFIRSTLTVIAFMLQIVVLLLPQGGLKYVTDNIPSYAYAYMWLVFVMIAISVWLIIMNLTRYKIGNRIPKENAPRNGFARRAFFGAELYIGVNALMVVLEISFVCIHYDGYGLAAVFVCAAATAAAVCARQFTHIALKNAELIPAPDGDVGSDDRQQN